MDEETRNLRRERWLRQRSSANAVDSETTSPESITQSLRGPTMSVNSAVIDLSNNRNEEVVDDDGGGLEISKMTHPRASSSDDECEIIEMKPSVKAAKPLLEKPLKSQAQAPLLYPKFSVCSYNVWFVREPYPVERMQAIASSILALSPRPLFVGLQEVTPLLRAVLFPLLQSAGYSMLCQDIDGGYGCAIGIRTLRTEENTARVVRHGFMKYHDSIMNRGLMWVHAKIFEADETLCKHVLFTTTHLESYEKPYTGASQRLNQIRQASEFCTDYIERWNKTSVEPIQMTVITGDLNWDDQRKRTSMDPNLLLTMNSNRNVQWTDVWMETNPGEEGFTYDAKMNPMLGCKVKGLRRRFDRCLVHFPIDSPRLTINSTRAIGTTAIDGLIWRAEIRQYQHDKGGVVGTGRYESRPVLPSDHFGLCCMFGGPM